MKLGIDCYIRGKLTCLAIDEIRIWMDTQKRNALVTPPTFSEFERDW